jgi:hypothetical protein
LSALFEQFARLGLREEVEFSAVESEHVGYTDHDFVGGTPLTGFQMAYVGRRRADSARHFLLRQVKLAASLANYLAESASPEFRHAKSFFRSPEPEKQ